MIEKNVNVFTTNKHIYIFVLAYENFPFHVHCSVFLVVTFLKVLFKFDEQLIKTKHTDEYTYNQNQISTNHLLSPRRHPSTHHFKGKHIILTKEGLENKQTSLSMRACVCVCVCVCVWHRKKFFKGKKIKASERNFSLVIIFLRFFFSLKISLKIHLSLKKIIK